MGAPERAICHQCRWPAEPGCASPLAPPARSPAVVRCRPPRGRPAADRSGAETSTSARAPTVEDLAAVPRCHSGPETVRALALQDARLERALHTFRPTDDEERRKILWTGHDAVKPVVPASRQVGRLLPARQDPTAVTRSGRCCQSGITCRPRLRMSSILLEEKSGCCLIIGPVDVWISATSARPCVRSGLVGAGDKGLVNARTSRSGLWVDSHPLPVPGVIHRLFFEQSTLSAHRCPPTK